MWVAFATSILVVVYNNFANRWKPFHGAAYVPVNLTFAAVVTTAAMVAGFSTVELGFRARAAEFLVALAFVGLFGVLVFALAVSRHGHRIADKRVAGMKGGALAWYALVRIPVGTAIVEEVLFRGVLFAAWRETGMTAVAAAIGASVPFGLWHIAPSMIGLRMNDREAARNKVLVTVLAAIFLTTLAGLGLTWLRVSSGGLAAPIALHAGVNSFGALAAVTAGRRTRT